MLVIAHRGASRAAPENTPAAFGLADEMGADGVELDVRRAVDGRLLVHHDPLPADAAGLDALPSLADVLDACGDRLLVNVEIKYSEQDVGPDPALAVVEQTVGELVRRGDAHAHRWLISSFSWEAVARCRALAPSIPTAFLVVGVSGEECARTAAAGHVAIHPWADSLTAETVRQCHDEGLGVNTWTCNDPERMIALAGFGVDGLCTDVPDVALGALGRRPDDRPGWHRPG